MTKKKDNGHRKCPACHTVHTFTEEELSSKAIAYIEICYRCGCCYDPRKAMHPETI